MKIITHILPCQHTAHIPVQLTGLFRWGLLRRTIYVVPTDRSYMMVELCLQIVSWYTDLNQGFHWQLKKKKEKFFSRMKVTSNLNWYLLKADLEIPSWTTSKTSNFLQPGTAQPSRLLLKLPCRLSQTTTSLEPCTPRKKGHRIA